MKKPKIYQQNECSYLCGACATASVLDYFGEEPDSILSLYRALREDGFMSEGVTGLYAYNLQNFFLRKDWVCLLNHSGGPWEQLTNKKTGDQSHSVKHQRIATWRIINQMLKDGYLCILSYDTAANTNHFAVIYDAFIKKNMHQFRMACSSQGFLCYPADYVLNNTGTTQLFVKKSDCEFR